MKSFLILWLAFGISSCGALPSPSERSLPTETVRTSDRTSTELNKSDDLADGKKKVTVSLTGARSNLDGAECNACEQPKVAIATLEEVYACFGETDMSKVHQISSSNQTVNVGSDESIIVKVSGNNNNVTINTAGGNKSDGAAGGSTMPPNSDDPNSKDPDSTTMSDDTMVENKLNLCGGGGARKKVAIVGVLIEEQEANQCECSRSDEEAVDIARVCIIIARDACSSNVNLENTKIGSVQVVGGSESKPVVVNEDSDSKVENYLTE